MKEVCAFWFVMKYIILDKLPAQLIHQAESYIQFLKKQVANGGFQALE